ncbi:MAG: ABC transporter substrate-binding protein [Melioribacteraceae bacterium]
MKKLILFVLVALLCLSCGKKDENVIKIGAVLPLSGSGAELAQQHLKGLQFAVDSLNTLHENNGLQYELKIYDDENQQKNTVALVNKLINVEKVDVIFTTISSSALAVAPIIEQAKIPHFANCGHPKITEMYNNVFRNFPSTKLEVITMSKFISQKLHLKNIGLLYLDDAYGRGGYETVESEFPQHGIKLLIAESYGKDATDFRATITKVISKKPEAIYVYGYGIATANLVNKIKEFGYKGILLGTYNFAQPPLTTVAQGGINDSYYTIPKFQESGNIENKMFWSSFNKKYGIAPPWNGVVEFDAINIINKAVKISSKKGMTLIEALKEIGNYNGIAGQYIFTKSKDWFLPMIIAKVKDGKIDYINF